MAQFKALKDLCNKFEEDLKTSTEIFVTGVNESFQDVVAKKLKILTLFNAKLKLLQAKHLSLTPQVPEQDRDESAILTEYGETIQWKLIEQLTVKFVTQAYSVKSLLMTSNSKLDPVFLERKQKIIKQLAEFHEQELALQKLDVVKKEREHELARVRERWHEMVGEMRDSKSKADGVEEVDTSGPLYAKLASVSNKIALMRWLVKHLVIPRIQEYDWLRDPRNTLIAIKMARRDYDVCYFMQ